jgi:hypothetical protein
MTRPTQKAPIYAALFALIAMSGLLAPEAAPALTSTYQPDATISTRQTQGYIGNDIYNGTGDHQSKHTGMEEGTHTYFHVGLENDGTADSIKVQGCKGNSKFTISYTTGLHPPRIDGSQNITGAVENGNAQFDFPSGGGTLYLTANIYAKTAIQGEKYTCKIVATSVASPTDQDVVKASVVTT